MLIEKAADYGSAIEIFFKNKFSTYTLTVMPDGNNYLKYTLTSDGTQKYYIGEPNLINRDIVNGLGYYAAVSFAETLYVTGVSLYDDIKSVSDYIVCWDHNKSVKGEKNKDAILEILKDVEFIHTSSISAPHFDVDSSQSFYIGKEEKYAYAHDTYQIVIFANGAILLDHVTRGDRGAIHDYYLGCPGSVDVGLLEKYLENH